LNVLANHSSVIYAPPVRRCVKPGCGDTAEATVVLRYTERAISVQDLLPERDPNFLDFCAQHAARLTPPVGWELLDDRLVSEPPPPVLPSGEPAEALRAAASA
jgi:hypothetical protein